MIKISKLPTTSHDAEIHFEELGRDQWLLIDQLERSYFGRKVFGTNCEFQNAIWFNGDGKSDNGRIIWDVSWTKSKAIEVLLKVIYFEKLVTSRVVISGIYGNSIQLFKKIILPIIESKSLLLGPQGNYLLGLVHLTDEDFLLALDSHVASTKNKELLIRQCNEIGWILESINTVAVAVPLFRIHARLPWQNVGASVRNWVTTRAKDFEVKFSPTIGYKPLPAETLFPIIERSLFLISEYGEYFPTLNEVLAKSQKKKDTFDPTSSHLILATMENYGPKLKDLIPPPKKDGISKKQFVKAGKIWIRGLLFLARGACVNIILLTSGLRNSDIRGLKVDDCRSSGRIDILFYLRANLKKTKNLIELPVPAQTYTAVKLLESIKSSGSDYLLDTALRSKGERIYGGNTINHLIRRFAEHFKIPFAVDLCGSEASAHCYRTTVAGWLGSSSNLSALMVRRLFGHSNNVMPSIYLRNNPSFLIEVDKKKYIAAEITAHQMALAASQGRVGGVKGDELRLGYENMKRLFLQNKSKSHSLSDSELVVNFGELIRQKIIDESVCAFLTPFGVICGRNPSNTTQAPCAQLAHSKRTKLIDKVLLNHFSDIAPENCVGLSCNQAIIGPWSEKIKETLMWYEKLLSHQLGDSFTDEHFIAHAEQFINQYGPPIKKIFEIEIASNSENARTSAPKDGEANA